MAKGKASTRAGKEPQRPRAGHAAPAPGRARPGEDQHTTLTRGVTDARRQAVRGGARLEDSGDESPYEPRGQAN